MASKRRGSRRLGGYFDGKSIASKLDNCPWTMLSATRRLPGKNASMAGFYDPGGKLGQSHRCFNIVHKTCILGKKRYASHPLRGKKYIPLPQIRSSAVSCAVPRELSKPVWPFGRLLFVAHHGLGPVLRNVGAVPKVRGQVVLT